jgi:hypothetical protein
MKLTDIIHSQEHLKKGILDKNCQMCFLIYLQLVKQGKSTKDLGLEIIE